MDDREKQLAHLDRYGVVDKDADSEAPLRKSPKREKKLRPETPVDWEIDLHGYGIQEAEVHLDEIFTMAEKAGMSRLRVIHGGRLGHYGPMAKHIQRMLKTKLHHKIQRIELDGLNDGALLIYLNK